MTLEGVYFDTNGDRVTFPHPNHPDPKDSHVIWNPKSIGSPAGAKTWMVDCAGHVYAAQG